MGTLEFAGVEFRYPTRPDTAALHDFSLAIRPRETVAIVGPSGAGKSTLFQLAERFYDPQAGEIRLDGVPLTAADRSEEHTSELQSLMRTSYAVFCIKKNRKPTAYPNTTQHERT